MRCLRRLVKREVLSGSVTRGDKQESKVKSQPFCWTRKKDNKAILNDLKSAYIENTVLLGF